MSGFTEWILHSVLSVCRHWSPFFLGSVFILPLGLFSFASPGAPQCRSVRTFGFSCFFSVGLLPLAVSVSCLFSSRAVSVPSLSCLCSRLDFRSSPSLVPLFHLPRLSSFSSDSVESPVSYATGSSLWAESVPCGFSPLSSCSLSPCHACGRLGVGLLLLLSLSSSRLGPLVGWSSLLGFGAPPLPGLSCLASGLWGLLVFLSPSLAGCHFYASALFLASASFHRCLASILSMVPLAYLLVVHASLPF